jgi:FKBP-type peptidyl-prolyl cis-trans isomerase (trigger factor)
MYNKKYLSKRPFMVVMNSYRPAKGAQTSVPGWADLNGGQWNVFESIQFVDRVRDKDIARAAIIIDVLEAKIVKNMFRETTHDDLLKHYLSKYKKETTEALEIWMEQKAQERVKAGLPALETEDDTEVTIDPETLQAVVKSVIKRTGGDDQAAERAVNAVSEDKAE